MSANGPVQLRFRSGPPPRRGVTESPFENLLRESVYLGATIAGAATAMVLQDEVGTWYRDGCGVSIEQLIDIEIALSCRPAQEAWNTVRQEHGLQVIETLRLVDRSHHAIGTLVVLSPVPHMLSAAQREGLRILADHIESIVMIDQQKRESRHSPRAPKAASFVPGLVHELGSFAFGISANLDAFEARYGDQNQLSRYGANIRKSLDRMSAFIMELREYGDPQRLSWSTHDFENLLHEAVDQLEPAAARRNIDLELRVDGPMPPIGADEQSLRMAFIHIIDLALQQEVAGARLIIHASAKRQGTREVIVGYLDCSNLKFKDLDPARLFEPFYLRISGLGRLTLPGARRVFESHGGSLTAAPGPEGGTRISFILPALVA